MHGADRRLARGSRNSAGRRKSAPAEKTFEETLQELKKKQNPERWADMEAYAKENNKNLGGCYLRREANQHERVALDKMLPGDF